jgi:hypothetical protein
MTREPDGYEGLLHGARDVSGIAGVASIIYGLTQGRHGSSAITSGIVLLVVAASTV